MAITRHTTSYAGAGAMTFFFNICFRNSLFDGTCWNCYLYGVEYLLTWDFGR
ncbi:hypothetical protein [Microcoleus sp. Pol10D4]|uniref:hypothetical protein n=1 Tax=Microcoleus sp. Pol10D4 TaxID=3055387 RepID=UPI002FCF435F